MSRTYRDPIHQEIHLDSDDPVEALLIKLIDTKEVQRLRRIKQLGVSWFTFHGAEHSRFPHSMGAMNVARMMFEQVKKNIHEDDYEDYKAAVLCAALLHDVGHGPFSHSCEHIVGMRHEEWTYKLIESPATDINNILKSFSEDLPKQVVSILKKTHPVKFLCNIVNSQLDCDRFDYLLRDSYQTGTAYGTFDLNRVISSIAVNLDHDCLVVMGEKGMLAVEDYLYARYSMYLQVYQHKKCLATDVLLRKLFKRVKVLAKSRKLSYMENEVFEWVMNPNNMSVQDYLMLDDISILQHIKHWMNDRDVILKDLASRFMLRKIFKAAKIEKDESVEKMVASKVEELRRHNMDPDYYLEQVSIAEEPYSFYHPEKSNFFKAIFVQRNDGTLKEISELSSVVYALVKGDFANRWIISV